MPFPAHGPGLGVDEEKTEMVLRCNVGALFRLGQQTDGTIDCLDAS
jgi:hypothetical protein